MTKTYTKFDISATNISYDLAKDILDIVIAFANARGIELRERLMLRPQKNIWASLREYKEKFLVSWNS